MFIYNQFSPSQIYQNTQFISKTNRYCIISIRINMLKPRLKHLQVLRQRSINLNKGFGSTTASVTDEKEKELERIAKAASIDEPPTSCCQSGCANCVFIAWAEALSAKMQDAGPEICEKILKMVDDPSMKAYLEMELRLRGLKKS